MGFEIYRIRTLEENRFALARVAPLPLGSPSGLLARNLPALAADNENWAVTPATLLQWSGLAEPESFAVFFNLTPSSKEQTNLLELVGVKGRTVSLITDVVFHFKVAVASRGGEGIERNEEELILPAWRDKPDRFEYLRLNGGTRGGNWAWAEPPQAPSATVL